MVVDLGRDDKFISGGLAQDSSKCARTVATDPTAVYLRAVLDGRALGRAPQALHALDRCWQFVGMSANERENLLLRGSEEMTRFLVRLGDISPRAHDGVGALVLRRWLESVAIEMQRRDQVVRREMGGKRKWQSKFARESRTEIARAKQVDRNAQASAGHGLDPLVRLCPLKIRHQFDEIIGKRVTAAPEIRRKARAVAWSLPGARPGRDQCDPDKAIRECRIAPPPRVGHG